MAGNNGHGDDKISDKSIETLEGPDGRTKAEIEVENERSEVAEKLTEKSETLSNLENKIPKEIFTSEENPLPLDNNKLLLDRITRIIVDFTVDKSKLQAAIKLYGEDFLGYSQVEDIPEGEYDFILQKVAIIKASHAEFIHLPPEQRKALVNALYPAISRQKLNLAGNSESIEVVHESSKVKDYPGYPYIERMVLNGDITQEDFNIFVEEFKKSESIEGMDMTRIHPAIKVIIDMIQLDEDSLKQVNKENFLSKFGDQEGSDGIQLSERIEYSPAIQLIAENYIEIPMNKNGQLDPKADFYTAVDVASNKIRWGVKNIDTTTVRYEKAILATKSIDIQTQIHGISELLAIQGISEGGPAVEVKRKEDEITRLLKESHRNAEEGRIYKAKKVEEANQQEAESVENDGNPEEVLNGWPPRSIDSGETSLSTGDKETEVGNLDNSETKQAA